MALTLFLMKAVLGTCLFTLILWWAQNRQPRAAGMMLTFPAVNGLGLLTAASADHTVMARAMLPMIALNGVLCALYSLLLRQPATMLPALSPRTRAGAVLGGCLALWGITAFGIAPWLQTYLYSSPHVLLWLGLYAVLGGVATALGFWTPVDDGVAGGRRSFWTVLRANTLRVATMMGLLMLVMLLTRYGAEAWAGRLSALPLIPFYSLLALSPQHAHRPQDATRLGQVGSTVLFGPLIAMAFAWGFAQYLNALPWPRGTASALMAGVLGLLVLWSGCGLLIWGLLHGLQALESRRPLTPSRGLCDP